MFLIEKIDNGFQLLSLGICLALSLYRAFSSRNQIWGLLAMFYGAATLGNLYWFLYMVLFEQTPYYSFISDYCWVSGFLFLLLLMLQIRKSEWEWKRSFVSILIPVFTFGMALFYMQWGDYLTNIFYAACMSFLLNSSIQGIKLAEKKTGRYYLFLCVLMYCAIEYCLWTSSCIPGDTYDVLYYMFDVILTLIQIQFYPAVRRLIRDELY